MTSACSFCNMVDGVLPEILLNQIWRCGVTLHIKVSSCPSLCGFLISNFGAGSRCWKPVIKVKLDRFPSSRASTVETRESVLAYRIWLRAVLVFCRTSLLVWQSRQRDNERNQIRWYRPHRSQQVTFSYSGQFSDVLTSSTRCSGRVSRLASLTTCLGHVPGSFLEIKDLVSSSKMVRKWRKVLVETFRGRNGADRKKEKDESLIFCVKRRDHCHDTARVSIVGVFPHIGVRNPGGDFLFYHSWVMLCLRNSFRHRGDERVPFIPCPYSFRIIAFESVVRNTFPLSAR